MCVQNLSDICIPSYFVKTITLRPSRANISCIYRGGSRGGPPFRKFRYRLIVASEKNPGIDFYSGFREKEHKGGGGVQFEILRNPGIDFYSGSRNPKKSRYRLL